MIDLYCERVAPGLLGEPLNAVTNLAFLAAAAFAGRLAARRRGLDRAVGFLVALVGAIGIGSLLFHTFATPWAMAADVVPILLFQVAFLWIYADRVLGFGWAARAAAVAVLVGAILVSGRQPELLNGSIAYLPALLTLLLLGIGHWQRAAAGRALLLTATGLLLVSLTARTADLALCDVFPVGSHLFWHLLNGLVLYLVMRALVLNLAPGSTDAGRAARSR